MEGPRIKLRVLRCLCSNPPDPLVLLWFKGKMTSEGAVEAGGSDASVHSSLLIAAPHDCQHISGYQRNRSKNNEELLHRRIANRNI